MGDQCTNGGRLPADDNGDHQNLFEDIVFRALGNMPSFPEGDLNSSLPTSSEMASYFVIGDKIYIRQNGRISVLSQVFDTTALELPAENSQNIVMYAVPHQSTSEMNPQLPQNFDTTAQELPAENCQNISMYEVAQQSTSAEINPQVTVSGDFQNPGMKPHSSGQISEQDAELQQNNAKFKEILASLEQDLRNVDNRIPQQKQDVAVQGVSQASVIKDEVKCDATCENISDISVPGPYNFYFSFGDDTKETKWKFASKSEKLYIDLNKKIEIAFGCSADLVQWNNLSIRLMLAFKREDLRRSAVERCSNHGEKKNNINMDNPEHSDHVIWCDDRGSRYEIDEDSNRRSVVVPFGVPRSGDNMVRKLIRFMCHSSCHKSATNLIMTLENE